MMSTVLEDLPNELLLYIFTYLNIRDIFHGFSQLNHRFNQLIQSVRNLTLTIEKDETDLIRLFADQINRLVIKNSDTLSYNQFHFLHSLVLYHLTSNQFEQIQSKFLPKLIYLSTASITESSVIPDLIQRIFSNEFPSLLHVNLGSIYVPYYLSWSKSPSLRSVIAHCSESNIISFILNACPNLNFLQVHFLRNENGFSHKKPKIENHPLKKFILIDSYHTLSFKDIEEFFEYMINIEHISLKFLCDIPFTHFIQIILYRLNYLRRFDCHINIINDDDNKTTKIPVKIIQEMHSCFNRIRYLEDQHIFTTKMDV